MAVRLSRDGYPHDCRQCAVSAEYRASHGCECDAEEIQARIECPSCGGTGGNRPLPTSERGDCDFCQGSGFKEYRRCPRIVVDGDTIRFMRAASLVEFGILPAAGGSQDQSNGFNEALGFYFGVKNELDEEDRRKKEAEAKAGGKSGGHLRRRNR